ncbi:MAG: GNAT family N-acetyltransferase [Bacilli bacterium]|nr:GNAT family N-acetyltransferase [Bacilli bacterium]MDD3305217.1 GNAT family N-acetyltransferase [Bacilli bacterium]MDD4054082.1 GNAT family N-acetyltransferase [Bacilli bacterium]MDD4411877.1 GNAT family N-acetyltransferase [Bacilli bacterium]
MKFITPSLETERLLLKKGNALDYEKVYEYDFKKLRNINGEFESVKQDKKYIEGYETYADRIDGVFDWIIYLKNSNIPIANITANREDKINNAIELSFNTHPNYWRHGYTTEALICVLNFLFEYKYDNVFCGYSEGNIKSKNLINKFGFQPYKTIYNSWIKDGISITDYRTILTKDKFYNLYKKT